MPKESLIIKDFSGGLNTESAFSDIEDNQCSDVNNMSFRKSGRLIVMNADKDYDPSGGAATVTLGAITDPGSGLYSFISNYDNANNYHADGFEWWLGVNRNKIVFYIVKIADGTVATGDLSTINSVPSYTIRPIFQMHDSGLRIVDTTWDANSTNKWYGHINRTLFKDATSIAISGWFDENLELSAPIVTNGATDGTVFDTDTSSVRNEQITLDVQKTDGAEFGWLSEWGTTKIGISFVYDGYQETKVVNWQSITMTSNDNSKIAFSTKIDTRASSGYDVWSKRLTGYNIYWTQGDEPWWLLNQVSLENGVREPGGDWEGWVDVGVAAQYTTTASPGSANAMYWEEPPRAVTWESMNGYGIEEKNSATYKTSVIANGRQYIGNVRTQLDDGDGTWTAGNSYPDRMLKSAPNTIDVFPELNKIDIAVNDGDEIVSLKTYGDRLFQFKKRSLYIVNLSKDFEYLEASYKDVGIANENAVFVNDRGVFWINKSGLFYFDGESVTNEIQGKIDAIQWKNQIDNGSTLGYDAYLKNIVIFNKPTWENPNEVLWMFNVGTKTFTKGESRISTGQITNVLLSPRNDMVWGNYTAVDEHFSRFQSLSGSQGHQHVFIYLYLTSYTGYSNGDPIIPAASILQLKDSVSGATASITTGANFGTFSTDGQTGNHVVTSGWNTGIGDTTHGEYFAAARSLFTEYHLTTIPDYGITFSSNEITYTYPHPNTNNLPALANFTGRFNLRRTKRNGDQALVYPLQAGVVYTLKITFADVSGNPTFHVALGSGSWTKEGYGTEWLPITCANGTQTVTGLIGPSSDPSDVLNAPRFAFNYAIRPYDSEGNIDLTVDADHHSDTAKITAIEIIEEQVPTLTTDQDWFQEWTEHINSFEGNATWAEGDINAMVFLANSNTVNGNIIQEYIMVLQNNAYPTKKIDGDMNLPTGYVQDIAKWSGGEPKIFAPTGDNHGSASSREVGFESLSTDQIDYLTVNRGGCVAPETDDNVHFTPSVVNQNKIRHEYTHITGQGVSAYTYPNKQNDDPYTGLNDYNQMVAYQLMIKGNALATAGTLPGYSVSDDFKTGVGKISIQTAGSSTVTLTTEGIGDNMGILCTGGNGTNFRMGGKFQAGSGLVEAWIVNPGAGYNINDVLDVVYPGTTGCQIKVTHHQAIVDLEIAAGGSGNTAGDELNDGGGNQIGEITAVSGGAITSVKITHPFGDSNTGYSADFACAFPGGGSGTVNAKIGSNVGKHTLAKSAYNFDIDAPLNTDGVSLEEFKTLSFTQGLVVLKTMGETPSDFSSTYGQSTLLWRSKEIDFGDPSTKKNFIKLYVTSKSDGIEDGGIVWKYSIDGEIDNMHNLTGTMNFSTQFRRNEFTPNVIASDFVKGINTIQFHMFLENVQDVLLLRDLDHVRETNPTGEPANTETVIINGETYTWKTSLSGSGDLLIATGGTAATRRATNRTTLKDAINGQAKTNANVHDDTPPAPGVTASVVSSGSATGIYITSINPGLENSIQYSGTALGTGGSDAWNPIDHVTPSSGVLKKELEINDITIVYRRQGPR